MDIDYLDIGKRIKVKRLKLKLSQEKLAEKADVSNQHISHIENGTTKLGLPTLIAISNALNTSVDELLCGSINQSHYIYSQEIQDEISSCNEDELRFLLGMIRNTKQLIKDNKKKKAEE